MIHSEPYPSCGAHDVASLHVAEKLLNICIDHDGGEAVQLLFKDMLEFASDGQNYRFKAGIGVAKIRSKVAEMWTGMSKSAKKSFLLTQLHIGRRYVEVCERLLAEHQDNRPTNPLLG